MKGLMFSFIMVLLALTLIALIGVQKSLVYHKREQLSIETRINDMNKMYESIVRDSGKALDIIAKRAIAVCISHMVTEGKALDQADFRLKELILNGTLNKTAEPLMEGTTFIDWIEKVKQLGELKGYDINITDRYGVVTFQNFEVKPYDSWNLLVRTEMYINITDRYGVANLRKNTTVNQLVSIENFEDPLYPLNTLGRATNVITKTPFEGNFTFLVVGPDGCSNKVEVNGQTWCIDNLKEHVDNSYYHRSTDGASFLDRLEGKLEVQGKYASQTMNVIGLESFVDKDYLLDLEVPNTEEKIANNQTNIDYLYFFIVIVKGDGVNGLDPTFRIDNRTSLGSTHQVIYGVSEILI